MLLSTSGTTRRRVTIVVWLLGAMLATTLIARRPSSRLRGLAWAEGVVLAAPADGILAAFDADLHEPVLAGDRLAHFSPEILVARRHVLTAELEALTRAESMERRSRDRLFERDREESGLELAGLIARVRESEARVRALEERLAIDQRLFEEGIAPEQRALEVRREITVAETRLAADRESLALARRTLARASDRADTAPTDNHWQIEAARRQLEEIETLIGALALHASIAGQITEVYRRPGEFLRAGENVLRISPRTATEVHAWSEVKPDPGLASSAPAVVRTSDGRRLEGRVLTAGAERLVMPPSLWSRPGAPEWGYLVRIALVGDTLAPGEPVRVALL